MLDTGTAIEINVFFDLALLLALGRLVDGHLDDIVGRTHDDTLER